MRSRKVQPAETTRPPLLGYQPFQHHHLHVNVSETLSGTHADYSVSEKFVGRNTRDLSSQPGFPDATLLIKTNEQACLVSASTPLSSIDERNEG
jgi:hypothetical protein